MIGRMTAILALSFAAGMAQAQTVEQTAELGVAQTIAIADVQRGQSVTVAGVVDRFFDTDEIRLRDDSGAIRVYLGEAAVPVQTGERLVIEGVMDDGLLFNELYARSITRESGEVIAVSGSGY